MLTAIIMAGGSGERFWPLSTPEKPKQLLKLFSEKTMIRETVERILPLIDSDKIFVATNILQIEGIRKELPEIPIENLIVEPMFKDTAAAIGYATLIIEEKFKEKLEIDEKIEVVVLASDHLIEKGEEFRNIIKIASKESRENSTICTLGIKPNKIETGYGYIEIKEKQNIILNNIYKVNRFREKPNYETAEKYVQAGNYLWNSGIFIFTTETIFKNFEVLMEEHSEIFKKLRLMVKEGAIGEELSEIVKPNFQKFEKISIDFGIMEYSKNIRVIPIDIGWNDIGSFTALEEVFEKDNNGNIMRDSKVKEIDSKNNIILVDELDVALLGVEDLLIIKNGKNLLISKKNRAQDIKKIIIKNNEKI